MHEVCAHIIGVQESRVHQNIDGASVRDRFTGSSAYKQGTPGVQLWIYLLLDAQVEYVDAASPRLLTVVLTFWDKSFMVVVAHAPINKLGDEYS